MLTTTSMMMSAKNVASAKENLRCSAIIVTMYSIANIVSIDDTTNLKEEEAINLIKCLIV